MLRPLHNPLKGKLRVLGFCSGSGATLWKTLELQRKMEKTYERCPFEIVGVFSDNPESKAIEFAKKENIPYVSLDIRKYYEKVNAPLKDRTVRAKYDAEVVELIKDFDADIILLAGYVWAVTDIVLDNYLLVNVHPGDLSIVKEGRRILAGHNGIKAAFDEGMDYLCSTSHLVDKYLDNGPILMISEKVPVDYTLHDNDEDRFRYYLQLVNAQSRLLGARTILEISLGNFQVDNNGKIYYKNEAVPTGIRIDNWNENLPIFERETEKLINPKSIAVIGASNKPGIGRAIVKNLYEMKFPGSIYAVNTKGEDVFNAKGVMNILDIPEDIDMAVMAVPSHAVLKLAEDCGKKGIKALVCITAGFSEVGGEGIINEKKLIQIVNKYNMRMLGPNCMGIVNTSEDIALNATILSDVPPKGNIAFVTQSGSMGACILDYAKQLGIGFSIIASLGNQADIDVSDFLPMLSKDDNTKVILLYLESIKNPSRFMLNVKKINKPIIVLKSGRSEMGAKAASSHTGSLSSNDNITDAYLKKANVIRVETLEDAFLLASTLSKTGFITGNKIGIVTNAGGPGILLTDALNKYGFETPQLTKEIVNSLKEKLLPEASINNPIDVVAPAPPSHYVAAVEAMLNSGLYDGLIINCVPPATIDTGEVARSLIPVIKNATIPILTCFMGPTLGLAAKEVMLKEGVQNFDYPEQLVRILNYMRRTDNKKDKIEKEINIKVHRNNIIKSRMIINNYKSGGYLSMEDSLNLLRNYGISMAKSAYIRKASDIENLDLNYPVVAKIDHKDIIHKSDMGGVRLNIANSKELLDVFNDWQLKFSGLNGMLVQEQVNKGIELIVGCAYDDLMGHGIVVGLGGIFVEVLKDVSFGHVPLNLKDIDRMINSLKAKKLLTGYRGEKGVNLEELKEIIYRVNLMLINHPEIEELDINPLIFDNVKNNFIAVDARIKIRG